MSLFDIATLVGGVSALWFFRDKIASWPSAIKSGLLNHSKKKWEARRKKLFQGLSSSAYLEWQQRILEQLYDELEIATVYGRRYPAAIIKPSRGWQYPFDKLCRLNDVTLPNIQASKDQMKYIKILGSSLKWPKMKGFALQRINLDKDGRADVIEAITTNYFQNIITTHILEWELYQLYDRTRRKSTNINKNDILGYLPRRALYHNNRTGKLAIIEPANAFPLISVQAMIVFRDTRKPTDHSWKIIMAKRSDNVVVKPGFFQLQPSGGFEVYGTEADDHDFLVREGFDLRAALFREYAEEIFNVKHLQVKPDSRDSISAVYSDQNVNYLTTLIDRQSAFIDYLGIVVDLALLRHELSFLIVIDDATFCNNQLLGSWEAKSINAVLPKELKSYLSGGILHGSSAALLQLAIENKRLQDLGISADLLL